MSRSSRKRPVEEIRPDERDMTIETLDEEPDAFDSSLKLEDLFPPPPHPRDDLGVQREKYRSLYLDVSLRLKQMEETLQYYLHARQMIARWKKRWEFTVNEALDKLAEENAMFENVKKKETALEREIVEIESETVRKKETMETARTTLAFKQRQREKLRREYGVLLEEVAKYETLLQV